MKKSSAMLFGVVHPAGFPCGGAAVAGKSIGDDVQWRYDKNIKYLWTIYLPSGR